MHEHSALSFTHPLLLGREPQANGGGAAHANEPPVLRSQQGSSECLSGLNSGFPVVCQRPHVDSYSPSLTLTLYDKKKAKAGPRTRHQQKELLFCRPQCLQLPLSFNLLKAGGITQMAQTGTRFSPCLKATSGSGQDQNAKVPRLTTHSYAAGLLPKHPFGHFYCIEQQEKGKKLLIHAVM